jgi:DNA-binding CsgD family transcriptional regulator
VLTARDSREVVAAAVEAGAHGIVTKDAPLGVLLDALDRVGAGEVFRCPRAEALLAAEVPGAPDPGASLTDREREVLRYIAEGLRTRAIAARLGLASKTVANHRFRIMAKLGVRDVATLTRYAVRAGLADGDLTRPTAATPAADDDGDAADRAGGRGAVARPSGACPRRRPDESSRPVPTGRTARPRAPSRAP